MGVSWKKDMCLTAGRLPTYLSGYQNEITTNKSPIGIWMRLETLQATL